MENKNAVVPVNEILSVIERVAMSPDADIQKMQALLDMQEKVLNRNAKMEYSAAFAEMQTELPEVTEKGRAHNSKYATFEDINAAVKPVLSKHGFGISFRVNQDDGKIKVTGVLVHKDGHSEQTDMVLPADTGGSKNAVQAIGSSVSYAKRYVLCALLNISTRGEDDDAAKADKGVTEFQKDAMKDVLMKCTQATRDWFEKTYNSIDEVPANKFTAVYEKLKAARDKAEVK
jgi:hypothetical protein